MATEGTGTEQFGSYLILEQIGDGGMAEIFLAKKQGYSGFEKLVALKRILPRYSQNPAFARMLIHEAKLAARIQHNNVVQVLDLGEADGRVYIAMEYIRGRDLAAILSNTYRRKEFLPVPLALFVGAEFLTGLDFAHRLAGLDGRPLGLIHRDISPQNILISFEGEVKVTDFGIARVIELGEGEALPGNLHGKFGYMSPEQVRNQGLDQRSDVFSAGIVVHEMLTGRRLFRGKTPQATVELVLRHKIPTPSSINPDVPKEIDDIIMRSLAREVNERYQTIGALLGDLGRAADAMRVRSQRRDLAVYMRRQFGVKSAQKRRASISPYMPTPGTRVPLGEILVRKGVISYDEVEIALAEQRARGGRIGEVLVEAGNITEEQLTDALSSQSGVPILTGPQLLLSKPDEALLARFPRAVAESISILPLSISQDGKALFAVPDPYDSRGLLEAKVVLGVDQAEARLVTRTAFREALFNFFPKGSEAPKRAAAAAAEALEAAGPPVVLFADGNVADVEPLAERIRAEDCEVHVAKDGKKAREICRTKEPIVAFLDASLPGIDGYNILLELRAKNPDAAIFITSGRKDEFREAKALELGADDFLVKPFSLEVTASKIRRELQKRASTRRKAPVAAQAAFRGMSGSLADMNLVDIVQSLELGRKTAHVVLQYEDDRSGELRVDEGDIKGCVAGELQGDEAFHRLAPAGEGIFRIEYRSSPLPINIHGVNASLILEALRREENAPGSASSDSAELEGLISESGLSPVNRPTIEVSPLPRTQEPPRPVQISPEHPVPSSFVDGLALPPVPPAPSPTWQQPEPMHPPPGSFAGDPRTQTGAWSSPPLWPQDPRTATGTFQAIPRPVPGVPPPRSASAMTLPPTPPYGVPTQNLGFTPPLAYVPPGGYVSSPPGVPPPPHHPNVQNPSPPWSPTSGIPSSFTPPHGTVLPRSASGVSPPPGSPLPRSASGVSPPPGSPLPRSGSGVSPPPGTHLPPRNALLESAPTPRIAPVRGASGVRPPPLPPPLPRPRGQSQVGHPERQPPGAAELLPPLPSADFYIDSATGELVVQPSLRGADPLTPPDPKRKP